MFIGMIAFWTLLILGAVYLIRAMADFNGKARGTVYTDFSSLEILKRRYAEGEISREQFEAMKIEIA